MGLFVVKFKAQQLAPQMQGHLQADVNAKLMTMLMSPILISIQAG
jgi:hypothetical protein